MRNTGIDILRDYQIQRRNTRMKRRSKKILSGITALICIIVMLIGGTLAWQSTASAVNKFFSKVDAPGANLHDDFDPYERDEDGDIVTDEYGEPVFKSGVIDKQVYVENTGNTDVYVRVQLWELLGDESSTNPYQLHMPKSGVVNDCGDEFHDAFGEGINAFVWTMGNYGEPLNYTSIKESASWDADKLPEQQSNLIADALGGAIADEGVIADVKGLSKDEYTQAGSVRSMEWYMDPTRNTVGKDFVGWVYDVDGYAYWSQALPPGAATGLLLNKVEVPAAGVQDYTYNIKVKMEYVDIKDIEAWTSEGADGKRIIDVNEYDQWTGNLAAAEQANGAIILKGPNAETAGVEASANAKQLIRGITDKGDWSDVNWDVGEEFTASGWDWIILNIDENGYALVTTKHNIGYHRFTTLTSATANAYQGSQLNTIMNNFYAELRATDTAIAAGSTDKQISGIATYSDYMSNIGNYLDGTNGFSNAGSGTKSCFALSYAEAAKYLVGTAYVSAPERSDGVTAAAVNNMPAAGKGQACQDCVDGANPCYWLRSPGRDTSAEEHTWTDGSGTHTNKVGVCYVVHDGTLHGNAKTGYQDYALRPALWVKVI